MVRPPSLVPPSRRDPAARSRLAATVALACCLLPGAASAEDVPWPGGGTLRVAVPATWDLATRPLGDRGLWLRAEPRSGAVVVQLTLVDLPAERALGVEDVRRALEEATRPALQASVEQVFQPQPLTLSQGAGWVVQLTDASLVGKPPEKGNFKVMRSAGAALDGGLLLVATIRFDDPALAEVGAAMALLGSVRLDRAAGGGTPAAGGFEFTIPQSRLVVKVPALGLVPDEGPAPGPNYFKRSRREPSLILSGWLEPAERYAGLKAFWERERRSPAYAGDGAPQHVELLEVGPWEVVSFDIPVPGGTSAHLRAHRVQAGTWIDLHLSSTQARPAAELRKELIALLGTIELAEKPPQGAPRP